MCDHDHDDDEAPTLKAAVTKSQYLWSTPATGKPQDVIQFDVSGATLVELRDASRKVLVDLLDGLGNVEIVVTLEIAPDEVQELGGQGPVSWQAIVTAVLPATAWLRSD